ncbi:hypothetical protein BT93_H2272 [Corymbia citriodora subsp. variegata]|nr:hypothetical protein BT93_H2272 [Corymbia citriodora subsp. variegata]
MLVVQQVEQCLSSNSLETRDYLRAIERLNSTGLGFEDVEMFLFRLEVNVLLNLVGLHHCMHRLEVPAEHVMEALQNSKISQRQVCIKWRTPRRLLPRPECEMDLITLSTAPLHLLMLEVCFVLM